MSARSRRPISVSVGMPLKSSRASSGDSTGVLPRLITCLGPRQGLSGPPGRPPASQKVLFDAGRSPGLAELLDISCDMHRLDPIQPVKPNPIAPAEELRDRPGIGRSRIGIADIRGEELDKPDCGLLASRGDLDWNERLRPGDDQLVCHHYVSLSGNIKEWDFAARKKLFPSSLPSNLPR